MYQEFDFLKVVRERKILSNSNNYTLHFWTDSNVKLTDETILNFKYSQQKHLKFY